VDVREPFDYHGTYYDIEDSWSEVRSPQTPRIPLYFGGSSDAAYRVGKQAGRLLRVLGERSRRPPSRSPACAPRRGRGAQRAADDLGLVPADPRPTAGARLEACAPHPDATRKNFEAAKGFGGLVKRFLPDGPPPNVGSQRLLAAAEAGELHDRCL